MPKRFTILVIPEGSHRVRRFSLKRSTLRWAAAASACCLLFLLGLTGFALRANFDHNEFAQLREEARLYQQERAELAAKLETLRKELVVMAQNDAKVRVMAKLAKSQADPLGGVGGPAANGRCITIRCGRGFSHTGCGSGDNGCAADGGSNFYPHHCRNLHSPGLSRPGDESLPRSAAGRPSQ